MRKSPSTVRTWSLRLAKLALVALLLWGVQHTLRAAIAELETQHWRPQQLRLGWLAAAGLAYAEGLWPCVRFWRRVLAIVGERPGWLALARAYYIGHLGKYLPGKAMVLVLRVGLLRGEARSATLATATVFYETLATMAVGAALAAVLLVAVPAPRPWLAALAAALAVVSALPMAPGIFPLVGRLTGARRFDPVALETLHHVTPRSLLAGVPELVAGWLAMGASLWCVLRADPQTVVAVAPLDFALTSAATALAVVAGFVALVPGGAGIREIVLLETLAPQYGKGAALVAAVLLRLVWLVAELAVSAILYPCGPKSAPAHHVVPPATDAGETARG